MVCFLFGAPKSNNITVVKVRKNVGLEEKKQKGSRQKPREATKEVQSRSHIVGNNWSKVVVKIVSK